METTNRFSARNRIQNGAETGNVAYGPGSRVENTPAGRYGSFNRNEGKSPVNAEEMAKRRRDANFKKMKDIMANKDIYEFTDNEKELFIEFHPELFRHSEDEIGNAEFITTSPVAELVLSDYFVKKERTKEMDFRFNFHSDIADDVLG